MSHEQITHNEQEPDQSSLITPEKIQSNCRKKYGNMVIFWDGPMLFSLGPDYCCFIPTFTCFAVVSVLVLQLVFTSTNSLIGKLISLGICVGYLVSYLLMAMSDPGIAHQNSPNSNRKCKKCNLQVDRGTQHCNDCDVCVIGYDHHCPWTSKCIVFCMIASIVCLADNAVNNVMIHPK